MKGTLRCEDAGRWATWVVCGVACAEGGVVLMKQSRGVNGGASRGPEWLGLGCGAMALGVLACSSPGDGGSGANVDVPSPGEDVVEDIAADDAGDVPSPDEDVAADVPVGPVESRRVLFIGNSYTASNNLPGVIAAFADATPTTEIDFESVTQGGAQLATHIYQTDGLTRVEEGSFDTVVLQAQSLEPAFFQGDFFPAASVFSEAIEEAGAKAVWFATWARREDNEVYQQWGLDGPEDMTQRLEDAYRQAAGERGGTLARVGATWMSAFEASPGVALHSGDGSHPSRLGTFVAACTLFEAIFGQPPVMPDPPPLGVSVQEAQLLCPLALVEEVFCPAGQDVCDGACVNLLGDAQHCGACGVVCPGEEPCRSGVCGCPEDTTACERSCVDVQTDERHCGGCGVACGDAQLCVDAQCVFPDSAYLPDDPERPAYCGGFSGVPGTHGQLRECRQYAHESCGALGGFDSGFGPAIGHSNSSDSIVCTQGNTHTVTLAELAALDAQCVWFEDDVYLEPGQGCVTAIHRYCQGLGDASGYGPVAVDGDNLEVVCLPQAVVVPTTFEVLREITSRCDPNALVCTAGANYFCTERGFLGGFGPVENGDGEVHVTCVGPTSPDFCGGFSSLSCNGQCVDPNNDLLHCGACGVACPGEEPCLNGVCGCSEGFEACDRLCVNTLSDPRHCGGCGQACAEGQVCHLSQCVDDYTAPGYLSFDSPCEGQVPQTHGQWLECAQAAHERCIDGYGFDSGFGPPTGLAPHRSGTLVCTEAQMHSVDVAQLSALDERCGVFDAQDLLSDGGGCATAIHRYCQQEGAVGGYGPVSVDGLVMEVACLEQGDVVDVDTAMLERLSAGCEPDAVGCTSGAWALCRARGFQGGLGPVEFGQDTARVVCVGPYNDFCAPPADLCDGMCARFEDDPVNCGECGQVCPGEELCIEGQCGCEEGLESCDAQCVDLQTDILNCGECGQVCPEGEPCRGGQCGCEQGLTLCEPLICVDMQSDVRHCGACGVECTEGQFCDGGQCAFYNAYTIGVPFEACNELRESGAEPNNALLRDCKTRLNQDCQALGGFVGGIGPATGFAPDFNYQFITSGGVCTQGEVHEVRLDVLSAFDEACVLADSDASLEPGDGCVTAIHRYCQDVGAVGGYGPVSVEGLEMEVVCLSDAEVITVPEANDELYLFNFQARFCPPGFPNPRPNAVSCNAPVWTFCQAQGFLGGYGPLGGTGNRTDVVCVGTP